MGGVPPHPPSRENPAWACLIGGQKRFSGGSTMDDAMEMWLQVYRRQLSIRDLQIHLIINQCALTNL